MHARVHAGPSSPPHLIPRLQEGICKKEFLVCAWWQGGEGGPLLPCKLTRSPSGPSLSQKFDSCFDESQKTATKDESHCMPLFDSFRECMAKQHTISSILKSAAGSNK